MPLKKRARNPGKRRSPTQTFQLTPINKKRLASLRKIHGATTKQINLALDFFYTSVKGNYGEA